MTRLLIGLLSLVVATSSLAMPTDELLHNIAKHVVKVHVALADGDNGSGSGVIIAKNQVVTNCHVVANAKAISVSVDGESYAASTMTPDWRHDICLIKVEGLNSPVATIGSSKNLKYEQPVFAIGYPGSSTAPFSTSGHVKALFPMDDSVIIRASSTFSLGASGGGLFDAAGNLVGVITLKSPGKNAYYYNMPVEWVQALLDKPEQAVTTKPEQAFWASTADKWPFFMRVVHPYLTGNWTSLLSVATEWTLQEPSSSEAWFYLAAAEYSVNDINRAEVHLRKVTAMNAQHSQAIYYLALIAKDSGRQHMEALTNVALLTGVDSEAGIKFKSVINNSD
jgi:serine protease Do